ncbi:MAG: peptidylprolyl isomerase [Deinococcales bacterium]|nr:peptidylprolyl isomerase [Chitinophagaceae bacterium]
MKKFLLLFSFTATCLIGYSQSKKVVADKIIGQVGDKIILKSDILNAIADYKRQGAEAQLPANPECSFLEGQLIQKALVLQAEKDSLPVTEDEIEAGLDLQIRQFIGAYGSKDALEEIAGKTIYQIKEDFRQSFKDRKLADQMRGKILDAVKITPTEVKTYFNKIPADSLPFYESEIEISQVLLLPKATKEVDEYVIKQLYDFKRQAESGLKTFAQLAKLNSDDKGTEQQGGTLSLNRTSKDFDKDFTAATFRLKDGQISPAIKSKFGYHIIYMVSRSGDDAIVRHILKIPPVTEDEVNGSIAKLDSIRKQIIEKRFDFGEAVNKFSEDESSKFSGGSLTDRTGSTFLSIDQLPDKEMVVALRDLKPGDISKPQAYVNDRGTRMVRIIYLKNRTDPHRENLKQDYNRIQTRALEEKKQGTLEVWFKEHLPNYYITIDKEYTACNALQDWWKYAANDNN